MAIQQDSSHPTGVSGTGGGELTRARDRKAEAALALRHEQKSWDEIAVALGYPTPRAALVATELALARGLRADESKEFMRMLAGKKLEELLIGVWAKATDADSPDHLAAVTKARELINDHAKLYGYIAPTEVSIYNPLESEIESLVGRFVKQSGIDVQTGDIFEMEANEDGVFTAPTVEDF